MRHYFFHRYLLFSVVVFFCCAGESYGGPYEAQIKDKCALLRNASPQVRAGACEALGFLRAYQAEDSLIECLRDPDMAVRRQAVLALAWCGGRNSVAPLLKALRCEDRQTRQAAHVALSNLTGMEFPFDALASEAVQKAQVQQWKSWWRCVPDGGYPEEAASHLEKLTTFYSGTTVYASSVYKGPPSVLRDGEKGPAFWQTKNVSFPQWCTIDIGKEKTISSVTVHQYSSRFVMTEYAVSTSCDNESFEEAARRKETTPVVLTIRFQPRRARYVRITSYGTVHPTYPTTFFEIEVDGDTASQRQNADALLWGAERAYRALGALGGTGATQRILETLPKPLPSATRSRPMVCAAIRALGRLKTEAGFQYLIELLDNLSWARRAAETLGDFSDRRAIPALLSAFSKYAKQLNGADPALVPPDDRMGFPSEDRMLETPYWILFSLCRLPFDREEDLGRLRELCPRILANLPGDHDTFMLYEIEVAHLLVRHLLETAGLRQEACEQTFLKLGCKRRAAPPAFLSDESAPMKWPAFATVRLSSFLPAVCTEKEDLPRLLSLLEHENGWVRLNAAKAVAWIGEKQAAAPLAELLRQAPAEGDFGYNGTFKNEEFDDPAPRWREGVIRALGLLGAHEHTALLAGILDDPDSVLEIRYAAAQALNDLGNKAALAVLRKTAISHPFVSVRQVAHDALRFKGISPAKTKAKIKPPTRNRNGLATTQHSTSPTHHPDAECSGVVFIKGDNTIPNTIGTVEQADRWRQTYVVTDSGPAYRPGKNLYILSPPRPDGAVTPLTHFTDGWVAEPEVSWDGKQILFCRRGKENPWWHIYRINADGTGLTKLTSGPYHHVGPAFLPDGRIILASSRGGIRDEYHGYPCTSLHVMEAEGSDLHQIATNIGRDNEPAVLTDGRIVFSRLEVFYSRNKTELTLHAVHPDGSQDVVLYGPERRRFWRQLDHGPRTPADGQENPLTHRVLRMTQPQPMPDGIHIVAATQGGLILIGPRRDRETIITPDNKNRAYTTPFPLSDGRIMCASTLKVSDRKKIDLGLYLFDPETKELELLYNDPLTADFEARPLIARTPPPALREKENRGTYSGRFFCNSVFTTQEEHVAERGKLVRLIEGVPVVARHSTHTNEHPVWKNHGGTFARVLGTAPLRADGSFYVEAPADRLLHFQVLDSDRRVLGNQLTWIYPRPGETKSCVGCHEEPHSTAAPAGFPGNLKSPCDFLPRPDNFKYRAKAWFKGHLPDIIEERTRTVRSVNLFGR